MKLVIVVALALVAVTAAAPVEETPTIVSQEFNAQPEGNYVYGFRTSNGIDKNEEGELKQVLDEDNKPQNVITVRGSFSYPGEDGKPVTITYYADETGFHAEGETIPKLTSRR